MSHGQEFAKHPGPECPPASICASYGLSGPSAQLYRFGNLVGRGSTVVMELEILLQPPKDLKNHYYLK